MAKPLLLFGEILWRKCTRIHTRINPIYFTRILGRIQQINSKSASNGHCFGVESSTTINVVLKLVWLKINIRHSSRTTLLSSAHLLDLEGQVTLRLCVCVIAPQLCVIWIKLLHYNKSCCSSFIAKWSGRVGRSRLSFRSVPLCVISPFYCNYCVLSRRVIQDRFPRNRETTNLTKSAAITKSFSSVNWKSSV